MSASWQRPGYQKWRVGKSALSVEPAVSNGNKCRKIDVKKTIFG